MADHISKRVVDAVVATLTSATIMATVGGSAKAAELYADQPSNNSLDPSALPAIYVFAAREQIEPGAAGYLQRDFQVSIVMLAGPDTTVTAQLFEMQLAVEKALAASGDLGGLAFDMYPVSADQVLKRGEAINGARSIDYLIRCAVSRSDPSL